MGGGIVGGMDGCASLIAVATVGTIGVRIAAATGATIGAIDAIGGGIPG